MNLIQGDALWNAVTDWFHQRLPKARGDLLGPFQKYGHSKGYPDFESRVNLMAKNPTHVLAIGYGPVAPTYGCEFLLINLSDFANDPVWPFSPTADMWLPLVKGAGKHKHWVQPVLSDLAGSGVLPPSATITRLWALVAD